MEGTLDYRWQKTVWRWGESAREAWKSARTESCGNGTSATWANGEAGCAETEKLYDYDAHVLPFTVRAKLAGKEPVVRRLCHDRDNGEFRSLMYS